jgi:peptide/nickel transport system permease protein
MRIVGQKLLGLLLVLLAVTFLTSVLLSLFRGNVVCAILQTNCGDTTRAAEVREALHLDDPVPVRYTKWLNNAVHGDLGKSYSNGREVSEQIKDRAPVTVALIVYAELMAFGLAVPLGVLAAYRADTFLDRIISTSAFGLLAIPSFILGLLLVYIFPLHLGLFDAIVRSDVSVFDFGQLFLPALTLALGQLPVFMRLLRTDMIATLQEDYIGMAKAKGLPTWHILLRHALRPSSLSLLTAAGITIGQLLAGTVVVESIFKVQGLGLMLVDGVGRRDLFVVQGVVAVSAAGFVLINFLVDLLYTGLDPRIRRG